jgi:hypothetical protein
MLDRYEDTLVILAKNIDVEMHHHHAVQLIVSLDNPYNAILDHQEIESVRGFLIDSDIPHACQSADSTVLVISVDATSAKGRILKQQLSKRTFALIDEIFSVRAINHFSRAYWSYYSKRAANSIISSLSNAVNSIFDFFPSHHLIQTIFELPRHNNTDNDR